MEDAKQAESRDMTVEEHAMAAARWVIWSIDIIVGVLLGAATYSVGGWVSVLVGLTVWLLLGVGMFVWHFKEAYNDYR